MFTIDGIDWEYPCTIERTSEVTPSDISGMLLNKQYFNDVLGTFLKYAVTIVVPMGYEEDYATIYEALTAPVDGHSFVLPYNDGVVQVTGRVQVISDRWVKMPNDLSHWRQTKFEIIANHPTKTLSLNRVISRGLTPMPSEVDAAVGDIYEYTQSGWVRRYWTDAEEVSY